jgi:hypothetical protein
MPYTFNGYPLPGAIQSRAQPVAARLRTADSAGRGGSYSQGGLVGAKRVQVRGVVNTRTVAEREAAWDALVAGCPVGAPLPLVLAQAGRHYTAEVEGISDVVDTRRPFALEYEANFFVPSGLAEADAETAAALAPGGGTVAAPAGDHPAPARIELSVTAVGANGTLTVSSTLTGRSMTVKPAAAGLVALDAGAERVFRAGADQTGEWVAGDWIDLLPGAGNPLTVATTGGLAVASVTVRYRARWRG